MNKEHIANIYAAIYDLSTRHPEDVWRADVIEALQTAANLMTASDSLRNSAAEAMAETIKGA